SASREVRRKHLDARQGGAAARAGDACDARLHAAGRGRAPCRGARSASVRATARACRPSGTRGAGAGSAQAAAVCQALAAPALRAPAVFSELPLLASEEFPRAWRCPLAWRRRAAACALARVHDELLDDVPDRGPASTAECD